MHSYPVPFTGGIGPGLASAQSLRSQDIGVSRELAAKFEQTSRRRYLKDDFQQVAPLDRADNLEVETT